VIFVIRVTPVSWDGLGGHGLRVGLEIRRGNINAPCNVGKGPAGNVFFSSKEVGIRARLLGDISSVLAGYIGIRHDNEY